MLTIHTYIVKWSIHWRNAKIFVCVACKSKFFFLFNSLSNNETLVHLLKIALGTGIFAMPNAFNHAGYLVSSILYIQLLKVDLYDSQR